MGGLTEEQSRLAELVYGSPQNTSAVRAIQAMMRQELAYGGEPGWLREVREVAQRALDEYYGNHDNAK